jgi:hypothetical protein
MADMIQLWYMFWNMHQISQDLYVYKPGHMDVRLHFYNNTETAHMKQHFLNPSDTQLNPICHLLALLGAHHILHVSR